MQLFRLDRLSASHLLATGTALRLLLAPFTSMPFDMQCWYLIAREPLTMSTMWIIPLWVLILKALNAVAQSLSLDMTPTPVSSLPHEIDLSAQGVQLVTPFSFNILVKLPLIVSDLAVTFLIYKAIADTNSDARSLRAAVLLWYINPFTVAISSGWGMFDTLPALFVTLALYLLTKKPTKSNLGTVSIWISVALKLYALALLPATCLYMRAKKERVALRVLLISIVSAALLSPVSLREHIQFFTRSLLTSLLLLPQDSRPDFSMGLSYWTILLLTPVSASVQVIIMDIVLVLLTGTVTYRLTRLKFQDPQTDLAVAYASSIIVIYLSIRGVPPQFFIWSLPLLAILVAKGRLDRRLFWLLSIIGCLFLLSMFHIFIYPLATYYPNELAWLYRSLRPIRTIVAGQARVTPGVSPGTIVLWLLGTSFSAIMVLTLTEVLFMSRVGIINSVLVKPLVRSVTRGRSIVASHSGPHQSR